MIKDIKLRGMEDDVENGEWLMQEGKLFTSDRVIREKLMQAFERLKKRKYIAPFNEDNKGFVRYSGQDEVIKWQDIIEEFEIQEDG